MQISTKTSFLVLSLFIKGNLIVTTIVFFLFLTLNKNYEFTTLLFTVLTSISTAATIYLIFYILFMPFAWLKKIMLWLLGMIFVILNMTLIVDFFIYRIWKFHINGMVLNIITTPGASDSIQIGVIPVIATLFIVIVLIVVEVFLYKFIRNKEISIRKRFNSKINLFILPLLLIIILGEKIIYGFANMYAKTNYMEVTKVVPLYQPMSFTSFMEKNFGLKGIISEKHSLGISENNNLKYPLNPIKIENPKPINIFIFALDSVRESILSQEVAPNISKIMKESRVYTNHISGGNATRFGIFSLMYGINSSYWFTFLNAQKGTVLFKVLSSLNYQTHIFSATSTEWPEFRKTVYFDIQENISDKHSGRVYQKDEQLTVEFLEWTQTLDTTKPIFSFVFLDAPHSNSYPKTHRKFQPDKYGDVNYLTVSEQDTEPLLNQYRNAIYFDDELLGKMIDRLKEKGLYENSIIIITADHGQEFYEHGNFGHNSSFNYEQVKVPFIMHLPDSQFKEIDTLSSHLDVVPTLLNYIGVTNEESDYSNGYDLLSDKYDRKYTHIGSWNENVILTDEYVYQFSNRPDKIFDNKTYKTDTYEEVSSDVKTNRGKYLLKVINENSRFID